MAPARHHYSLGHMMMFVSLVLSAAASLRSAGQSMRIALKEILKTSLPIPAWNTGRLWLLRLGLYKLSRLKEQASDWVWIIDHSIQIGTDKCLVILGVRLSQLPGDDLTLQHEDVEPIELLPVKKSNGEVVFGQLEKAVQKTGIPREILGDNGPDLKAGIEKFCEEHKATSYVHDIKHKTAAILKHEFERDEAWIKFNSLAAQTKQKVLQTPLAYLAPPNQRPKARYMNIDRLVEWGQKMLVLLCNRSQGDKQDTHQVQEKFGWILTFREALEEWSGLLSIMAITEHFVRSNGLHHDCSTQLEVQLETGGGERTERVRNQLIEFFKTESSKARIGERLLGSSEVIESVFGKLKLVERDQSKSGFTALVLNVGAMVSITTKDVIQKAIETIPTKKIFEWAKETLGESVQSKRKKFLSGCSKTEQKSDQLVMAA